MAKWGCRCGATLRSGGSIPNPTEWLAVSDADFEAFSGLVRAEEVYDAMTHAFRCAECGRLYIYWSGMAEAPTVYSIDGE